MPRAFPTAVIENLQPLVDCGRYMVKRVVGDDLAVEADIFKDGHDIVAATLKWRQLGETHWHETPMAQVPPSTLPRRAWWWTGKKRASRRGMNFSHAPPRACPTAVRRFAIPFRGSITQRRWDST